MRNCASPSRVSVPISPPEPLTHSTVVVWPVTVFRIEPVFLDDGARVVERGEIESLVEPFRVGWVDVPFAQLQAGEICGFGHRGFWFHRAWVFTGVVIFPKLLHACVVIGFGIHFGAYPENLAI